MKRCGKAKRGESDVGVGSTGHRSLRRRRNDERLRPATWSLVSLRPSIRSVERWGCATAALLISILLVTSVVPIAYLVATSDDGDVLTGATGPFAADQLQYATWMRSASDHNGLAGNLYDLVESRPVLLQPMIASSAVLLAIGASPLVALLVWLPVAAISLGLGVGAVVRRFVAGPTGLQMVAGIVALFALSPVGWLLDFADVDGGIADDVQSVGSLAPGPLMLGYFPAAVSVGVAAGCIVRCARFLSGGETSRAELFTLSALSLLAGWLHPWQGVLLATVMGLVAVTLGSRGVRWAALPVVAAATGPAYYALLPLVVDSWATSSSNASTAPRPVLAATLSVLPLAVVAALGVDRQALRDNVAERLLVAWPLVVAAVYLLLPQAPGHFLTTAALPLGVLAMRGVHRRMAAPLFMGVIATLLVLPGMWQLARFEVDLIDDEVQAHRLTADEEAAISALASGRDEGGVLSGGYLGAAIPAMTGRPVWVGHPAWTRAYGERAAAVEAVVHGRGNQGEIDLVASSGASTLVLRCGENGPLPPALEDQIVGARRFGCVRVFDLDPGRSPP